MHICPEWEVEPTAARILLVEDEVMLRMWIADELRESGFTVVEARNADEATAVLASGSHVDLIFSDVRMPGSMNGLEFANRATALYPLIPIVITSSDLGQASTSNVWPFLRKPYTSMQVVTLLSEVLRSSQMPDAHD
jgi:two-component system, response regulator PdtaR